MLCEEPGSNLDMTTNSILNHEMNMNMLRDNPRRQQFVKVPRTVQAALDLYRPDKSCSSKQPEKQRLPLPPTIQHKTGQYHVKVCGTNLLLSQQEMQSRKNTKKELEGNT